MLSASDPRQGHEPRGAGKLQVLMRQVQTLRTRSLGGADPSLVPPAQGQAAAEQWTQRWGWGAALRAATSSSSSSLAEGRPRELKGVRGHTGSLPWGVPSLGSPPRPPGAATMNVHRLPQASRRPKPGTSQPRTCEFQGRREGLQTPGSLAPTVRSGGEWPGAETAQALEAGGERTPHM